MSREQQIRIVSKFYDPFPAPTEEALDGVEQISAWLLRRNIRTPGVIAAAEATDGHWYFAFSMNLQSATANAKLYSRIGQHRRIQTFCTKVDQEIFKAYLSNNPTCAEKKVISQMRKEKKTMKTIGIGEHPTGSVSRTLTAHIAGGDGTSAYIAPCDSCRHAYKNFK